MTCPNCGRELKEGEVCTCTENNEVQSTQPEGITNEETAAPAEETAQIIEEATAPAEEAEPTAEPENEPTEEAPIKTAEAPTEPQEAQQPVYQAPEQNAQQQNAYYNPYDNAAYYQQNGAQYTQQAPYYVPTAAAPTASTDYPEGYKPKKKYVAVILAATLGVFGIHNFYLGNNGRGVAQILLTLLGSILLGLGLVACEIWVLVETVQLLIEKEDADGNGYKIMTLAEEIAREQKKAE